MIASGHIGVGYLTYAVFRRLVRWSPPGTAVLFAVIVGSMFPDMVDKPLAWGLGVLPAGRSLGHSLLTATVVIAVLLPVAVRYGRTKEGAAFSVGWLSHIAADAYTEILVHGTTSFLFWPLPARDIWAGGLWVPPQYAYEVNWGVLLVAFLVWLYEGAPGVAYDETVSENTGAPPESDKR